MTPVDPQEPGLIVRIGERVIAADVHGDPGDRVVVGLLTGRCSPATRTAAFNAGTLAPVRHWATVRGPADHGPAAGRLPR